jgi:DNA-binding NtrC family response regulator
VVDDNQLVLTSTRKLLTMAGYQVLSAATPAQALKLFTTYRSRIDLVLLDILLPLMSGLELASRFSEIRASMRILYMSSCVDRRALKAVTPRQLIDFIEKPFQADDLIRKTRGILARPLPGRRQP